MAAPGMPAIPSILPVQGKAEMALDAARVYAEEEAKRKRLECRFYEAQYPEIEEVVMVNVRNIAEMGAYVVLLEYNDIEGMILLSELSRRRIRSINKLIRVNRNEVAMVLRVDREKVGQLCAHSPDNLDSTPQPPLCAQSRLQDFEGSNPVLSH